MEELLIEAALAVVKNVPRLIEAIRTSTTLDEEKKKAYITDLRVHLDSGMLKVAAVKFRDS